jgi:DNA mismatch repair protein MutL
VPTPLESEALILRNLRDTYAAITAPEASVEALQEAWNDALKFKHDALATFRLGYLSLPERGLVAPDQLAGALARPDVGFAIWHEGKLVEQWRAPRREAMESLTQRLSDVMGETFAQQSVAIDFRSDGPGTPVRVWGRAGLPDIARARPDLQFAYVNGRFVRDKVLTHAARAAYEDVLHGQRQPLYALYVEIDPTRVDVNVHPTKIEVRFRDSREVHQAVRHAVENALAVPRANMLMANALQNHELPMAGTFGSGGSASGTSALGAATSPSWPNANWQQAPMPLAGTRVPDVGALWQSTPRTALPAEEQGAQSFAPVQELLSLN